MFQADVVLRDGSTVRIRNAGADDEPALLAFLQRLSPQARYTRFFSGAPDLPRAAHQAVTGSAPHRLDLLAWSGSTIVAHAAYVRMGAQRAEVAFAVDDRLHGRGIATLLLGQLAETADRAGITVFEASVLPQNHEMIEVFRLSGFPVRVTAEPGTLQVEFPTSLSPTAIEHYEQREQMAAAAAVGRMLRPRSVAVIGASRSRGTIGGELFHNLLAHGFTGAVYPVNPHAPVIQSVVAYRSVLDVPGPVDLAVIVVPAVDVLAVARECGRKGVASLVVISAGFGEAGAEGIERQRELLSICRESGMRLCGPNCMGVINTDPAVSMDATFGPVSPPPGRVGFLSQSGGLGLAVIDFASALSLGLAWFVSVGNKADLSGNDFLQFAESDPNTELVLLYLESFGNPRKFARIARRVARRTPIIAVKSGRSAAGARATSSHTGALLAASDVTVDALFRQAGVIRTDTLGELFDVAAFLANQPPPTGRRIGIITNGGGPGILCADACEAEGLTVPLLPDPVVAELHQFLRAEASLTNPVDMLASAGASDFGRAIEVLARSEAVDAIVVLFVPPLVTRADEVALAIRAAARGLERPLPIATVFLSARGVPAELKAGDVRIPSYQFPEDAARALALAARYGEWQRRPAGEVPTFDDQRADEAAGLIASVLATGGRWLTPQETHQVLGCHGIPLVPTRFATTPDQARAVAGDLVAPLVLKAIAPTLLHKSDAGGVRLNLSPDQIASSAEDMAAKVTAAGHRLAGFQVQTMIAGGVEMLVGVVHDRLFGPVLAAGAGGVAVELLKDVAVRITPLTTADADDMLRSLRTFPLLTGYRGAVPVDLGALKTVILRVSAMVEAHPEIAELDCNPVIVSPAGATVADARIRLEVPEPRPPLSARTT
ncbi:MAG TPA: GNAT family N-acetyltransferase [Candidatus Limnocylindrales bacterium]|nr:GNAT family N-acetyltransferase [Candidatus Limnocylindrales bacterium]